MSPAKARETSKDTIYIDVDEEITGIIHKISSSPKNIIALVLPKRAAALQSIVNMKLLKRTADQHGKNVVLITSEAGLMPLAGAAGLYVAANPTSKPYLPTPPIAVNDTPETADMVDDVPIDPNTPVGDLLPKSKNNEPGVIEIDNSPAPEAAVAGAAAAAKKAKGGKKLKVPSFDKFRTKLIIAAAVLLLLVGFGYWALAIAPRATVTLKTASSETPTDVDFFADPAATEVDVEKKIVPATSKEKTKTESEKAPATGQVDKGTKAAGTVKIYNCSKADKLGDVQRTVPAGTGISSGNLTFILAAAVTVEPSGFAGDTCKKDKASSSVAVNAQGAGDQYNLSARTYAVSGLSSMSADGSAMSGGTTQIVKVISAGDVDSAKQKLAAKNQAAADEVKKELSDNGFLPIAETFSAGTPVYTPSPAVGSEAGEVTVSAVTTFTMLGVKEDDLKKLVAEAVKSELEEKQQSILSEGLGQAIFRLASANNEQRTSDKQVSLSLNTKVVIGPDLQEQELKQEIAGKKSGEAEQLLAVREGVDEPSVKLSPFWVTKIPGKDSKITINIQQADGTAIP